MKSSNARRNRRRGGTALEMALFMPWFVFLFVGAFDWGFYAHALISTESAARVATLFASGSSTNASNTTYVCTLVLEELKVASNVSSSSTCTSLPVVVTVTQPNGPDSQPTAQV